MQENHLQSLPNDIINEIINYLPIKDQLKLFISCKKLNKLIKNTNIGHYPARQIYQHYLNLYNENKILKKWVQKFPTENRSRQVLIFYPIMGGLVFALTLPTIILLIVLLSPQISSEEKFKRAINCSIVELPFAIAMLLILAFSMNDLKIEYFTNKHFFNAENQIFFYKKKYGCNEYDLSYFDFMDVGTDIPILIDNINKIEKALLDILTSLEKERVFVSREYEVLKTKSNFFKNKPPDYQTPRKIIREHQPSSIDYAKVSLYRYLEHEHEDLLPTLFNPK